MTFLHPDIHQKVAKWFGVKGKREADLSDHIAVSDHFSSFGQSEKLTIRLQRILSGYPCDASIMKELLQNADDADATELMFIKDFRSLPSKHLFSENWASVQGPALCVYNDSYFSDKDFAGIQNLGEGSKGDDPIKTGQYGVGFNAVYHLTDIPSFITVGPNTEKTICILDPHVKYVPWATSKAPGGKICKLEKLRAKYKDAFSGYLEKCVPLQQKGTLFRFPLRTESMAKESHISKRVITTNAVLKLLDEFRSEMFDALLFLHSVEKITIAHINNDGRLIKEYSAESKMSDLDISKQQGFLSHLRTQAQNVKDRSTGIGIGDIAPSEIQLSLSVKDSESKYQKWLVVHHSGFKRDKDLPESLMSSWEKGDIGLLPRGGVAVPVPSVNSEQIDNFDGKAFCILPMPISTGLPVHINGHFALDHEARRNLWHGTNDYRCDWNKHIVDAIIIPSYISALQALKIELECTVQMEIEKLQEKLKIYYSFFPDVKRATDMFWKSVTERLYSELVDRRSSVFSVIKPVQGGFSDFPKNRARAIIGKIVWVPLTVRQGFPGYFSNLQTFFSVNKATFAGPGVTPAQQFDRYMSALDENERNIRLLTEVLRDLNMKVIEAPERIHTNLVESNQGEYIRSVTPGTVITFLKSHCSVHPDACVIGILPRKVRETPLKSVSAVKRITAFISKAENFASEICGLPLAITSDEDVDVFHNENPVIVTQYSDLLMAIPNMVLHQNLTKYYLQHAMHAPSLKHLSLQTFAALLPVLLDGNKFRCDHPVLWNSQDLTQKWIVHLWKYLEEEIMKMKPKAIDKTWIMSQLNEMESWCILPAKSRNSQLFLYPLSESAKILNLDSVIDEALHKILTKLSIPHFDQSILRCQHQYTTTNTIAPLLVASWDRPSTVLFVLSEMTMSEMGKLKEDETRQLLNYFSSNLSKLSSGCDSHVERLIKLPFYTSLTGTLVSLSGSTYVVKSSSILPTNGLKEWSDQTGLTLVKHDIFLDELYEYMNCQLLTPSEVYSVLLIPRFHCIPKQFRSIHIKCIKDKLLKKADVYTKEQKALIEQVKNLKFIETSDGTLHRACEFYSNQEIVFSTMCPPSAFPPPPYSSPEWYRFLVLIGLQVVVTVAHFIAFVKEIEHAGSTGISGDIAHKSEVLTSHLCHRPNKVQEGLLSAIRNIKFLLPYDVRRKHEFGKVLIQIHPQMQETKYLVCYAESVAPQHCCCVWTSKTMYRSESDPSVMGFGQNLESAYSQLGLSKSLSPEAVTQHVQNVCASITRMQKKHPINDRSLIEVLKEIMTSVYDYFHSHGVSDLVKERLSSFCTILLPDDGFMVAAKDVVTSLSKDEIIKGYIYSGPVYFGRYFHVFHQLGASENVSAKHFALVLNHLRDNTHGQEMEPNELNVAKLAMEKMFHYLQKEACSTSKSLFEIPCLFLPSDAKTMIMSKELVLCNNKHLQARIKSLNLNYFVGFSDMRMDVLDPLKTISLIPQNHRPLILTDIVKEVLSETSKQMSHRGHLCQEISNILVTPEFLDGLLRLINHSRRSQGKEALSKSECEKIDSDLQRLDFFEVENLHTVLSYNKDIVPNSETQKECMLDFSDNEVCIYLSSGIQTVCNDFIVRIVAGAIDRLTEFQIGQNILLLPNMLQSLPREIGMLLDSMHIMAFEYSGHRLENCVFPPPGTIIPEKFHFLLDNSFGHFTPGEYAGFEIFDYLIDEDFTGEMQFKEGVFIVYVIIREVMTHTENPLLGRYKIEVKDGKMEEVSAIQLYKFIRDKKNICSELQKSSAPVDLHVHASVEIKAILKDIRKTLKDAWAFLGERERNRVKKRLYLKWHPDKNPERKELCTEICKYIALYVQRLEKGLDIDDFEDYDCQGASYGRDSGPDYSWFYHFDARSRRQRDYQNEYETFQEHQTYRNNFRSTFGQSCHQSARQDAHPHHLEAKRWFRQARADLDAATEVLGLTRAFNWICFKCQQAAEKALKAMWYNRDARYADSIRSHNICSIASSLGNPILTDLVTRLQNIVIDFERLRYPDRLSYPSIPADVYTDTDARAACELTQKVITIVGDELK